MVHRNVCLLLLHLYQGGAGGERGGRERGGKQGKTRGEGRRGERGGKRGKGGEGRKGEERGGVGRGEDTIERWSPKKLPVHTEKYCVCKSSECKSSECTLNVYLYQRQL